MPSEKEMAKSFSLSSLFEWVVHKALAGMTCGRVLMTAPNDHHQDLIAQTSKENVQLRVPMDTGTLSAPLVEDIPTPLPSNMQEIPYYLSACVRKIVNLGFLKMESPLSSHCKPCPIFLNSNLET